MSIVIDALHPREIPIEDFEELAAAIRTLAPDQGVALSHAETKDFMPLVDILTVWIPNAVAATSLSAITLETVAWLRRRMRQGKEKPSGRVVAIYAQDGSVLRILHVADAEGEPIDQTADAVRAGWTRRLPQDVI